ncbi:MAG TPA: hypothetical protein VFM19_01990 [Candidatus Limnocylindria bacterium]|nr:hypothetical protein [Candidatus Limnocylindria bacterium]
MSRADLERLTDRWRRRHDAARPALADRAPMAAERAALASRAFPHRKVTPTAYVAAHGDDMAGFTYDDERHPDPALDAWLVEVGQLLAARRR